MSTNTKIEIAAHIYAAQAQGDPKSTPWGLNATTDWAPPPGGTVQFMNTPAGMLKHSFNVQESSYMTLEQRKNYTSPDSPVPIHIAFDLKGSFDSKTRLPGENTALVFLVLRVYKAISSGGDPKIINTDLQVMAGTVEDFDPSGIVLQTYYAGEKTRNSGGGNETTKTSSRDFIANSYQPRRADIKSRDPWPVFVPPDMQSATDDWDPNILQLP